MDGGGVDSVRMNTNYHQQLYKLSSSFHNSFTQKYYMVTGQKWTSIINKSSGNTVLLLWSINEDPKVHKAKKRTRKVQRYKHPKYHTKSILITRNTKTEPTGTRVILSCHIVKYLDRGSTLQKEYYKLANLGYYAMLYFNISILLIDHWRRSR